MSSEKENDKALLPHGFGGARAGGKTLTCFIKRLYDIDPELAKEFTEAYKQFVYEDDMILGFSKEFSWGEPTNFVEKIKNGRKIHTIREDKHRRWRKGMTIHFATGVRTPDYWQFEEMTCKSIQDIKIINKVLMGDRIKHITHTHHEYRPLVIVDDRALSYDEAKELSKKDGFDSFSDFKKWFDEDFEGRLIHWTDKRY